MALVDRKLEPDVTCTVKATPVEPEALDTETFWAAGLDPCCAVKVSEVGDGVTFPVLPPLELVTVSVTPRFDGTPLALKGTLAV